MTYVLVEDLRLSGTSQPRSRHLLREAWEMRSREEESSDTASIQITFKEVTAEQDAVTSSQTVAEITESRLTLGWALERQLDALFEIGKEERFEDGVASNLSTGLRVLFRDFSSEGLFALEQRLRASALKPRMLAEVLYTLGQIDDKGTADWRFATLVDHLKSPLPSVRDAAAVGLAYLDDKRAAPYLREAIERETSETFRGDLQAIMEQLTA